MQVHPNVHFVSDVHAYMMESAEVIGILAGRFDHEGRVVYIQVQGWALVGLARLSAFLSLEMDIVVVRIWS